MGTRKENLSFDIRGYRVDKYYFVLCRKAGYRCLLASEVVQLLCIVPVFFDFIGKDPGNSISSMHLFHTLLHSQLLYIDNY